MNVEEGTSFLFDNYFFKVQMMSIKFYLAFSTSLYLFVVRVITSQYTGAP